MRQRSSAPHPGACETPRKLAGAQAALAVLTVGLALSTAPVRAWQPEPAHEAAEAPHEDTILGMVARVVNFGVLAGGLAYFLRAPLATYLSNRGSQIRADLVNANETKRAAAAQIEEIDRKMEALPAELDALRSVGAKEIAAEEERIRAAAVVERDRLLEQARREIDLQVRVVERQLVSHSADLAVGVATERIKKLITDDDRTRLVDRYVQQLKS